jgi:cytochrome bd-type quinol oxidase subunit 2
VPIVLLYQGWTYYVFRRRVTAGPSTTTVTA